jgi:hypothetical protein
MDNCRCSTGSGTAGDVIAVLMTNRFWILPIMKSHPGPPMTLGNAGAGHVRLIVWCRDCRHTAEPDPKEMAE